ncbi:hypothetical protein OE88DRAFT_12702 [Heliocybe sulcata]|uniref:DUF6533 domain-containing protein n=1 Tax=Heliocybe sulcata TaxID=5364 RepID=A0A5C3NRS4_9AGAM|nr:hypothetical protein OE88DRAFT_12702 [Heliocybe sulcata]
MASELQAEIAAIISSLEGIETAKHLALATFAMSLYEYAITLEKEIHYFWAGSWSISRALFFFNRYVPLIIMTFGIVGFYGKNLSLQLYRFNQRKFCVTAFTILGVVYKDLNAVSLSIPGLEIDGCIVPPPNGLWRIWVPALILHTLLYVFTAVQAVLRRNVYGKRNVVLERLLRDGGVLYLAVLVTVGFSGIGSTRTDNPSVSTSAVYSNMMVGVVSLCMSRVMFSIHSLADNLNCDPDWLLNHLELSRVNWKKGENDGELVVEMEVVEAREDPEARGGYSFGVRASAGAAHAEHEAPFLIMR